MEITWAQKLQPYISEDQVEEAWEEHLYNRDNEIYQKYKTMLAQRESRLNAEKTVPIVKAVFGKDDAQEISYGDGRLYIVDHYIAEEIRIDKEDLDGVIDVLQRIRDQIRAGVI